MPHSHIIQLRDRTIFFKTISQLLVSRPPGVDFFLSTWTVPRAQKFSVLPRAGSRAKCSIPRRARERPRPVSKQALRVGHSLQWGNFRRWGNGAGATLGGGVQRVGHFGKSLAKG
jgi:hypothetical protein